MARPAILPLPDGQATLIYRGLQTLPANATDQTGNRPFLAAFIRLVYQATDRVFGVQTYRQLLVQFGVPRAPSSTTIHSEIEAFRQELIADVAVQRDNVPLALAASTIDAPERLQLGGAHRGQVRDPGHHPATAGHVSEEALEMATELARLQQQEVTWLRQRADDMETRARASERARQAAELDATAARAELAGREAAYLNLQQTMHELTATIQLTQERATVDNRANMQRVDDVRRETRDVDARLKAAEQTLTTRDQALRNANALADGLRRQLNELRRQMEKPNE